MKLEKDQLYRTKDVSSAFFPGEIIRIIKVKDSIVYYDYISPSKSQGWSKPIKFFTLGIFILLSPVEKELYEF